LISQLGDDFSPVVELGIGLEQQVDIAPFAIIKRSGAKQADFILARQGVSCQKGIVGQAGQAPAPIASVQN
jgi:hypothetical protein